MAGLYIHIPFCASRCTYCDFYSSTNNTFANSYVDALCKEITLKTHNSPQKLNTIYLGGGTPSQLTREQLFKLFNHIFKCFDVSRDAEITMECNPDDITPYYIYGTPVNRVSMGAQTFSDERLKFLNRRHCAQQVMQAVNTLRNEGIGNISVDLIFGFPNETLAEWQADIDRACALQVEHLSAYALMYEQGTPLYNLLKRGKIKEIDEELSLKMFDTLIDKLTAAGYEHYEISNFALPGKRSQHNQSYWKGIPYTGIGASAHSYDGETRRWNIANLQVYIRKINEGIIPEEVEILDRQTRYNDLVATALRTKEGIDLNEVQPDFLNHLHREARKHIEAGLLEEAHQRLKLTRKGLFLSDMVMSNLMFV